MKRITMKAARINRGLTQADAAKALNVTKKTVGSWESGKTKPRLDKIEPICMLYECSYDEIVWNI